MLNEFTFSGLRLRYATDDYNQTANNERTVEIPLARWFIGQHGIDLEVGNVLRNYGHRAHKVVDKYDPDPSVVNIDVMDIVGPVRSIVAISTLEHVGWDEPRRDPLAAVRALDHLIDISEHLFVTVPMGYHPTLDHHLLHHPHGARCSTMVRDGMCWRQTDELEWKPYGQTTGWAESVFIGEWH